MGASLLLPVNASQLFNMKSMILIAVFLAVAAAAPQDNRPILIVKQSQNHDTEKQVYSLSYETENGIVVSENGFQAKGDHLPTPPPLPEHVVKMLNDLRAAGKL